MSRRRRYGWDDDGYPGWYYEPSTPLPVRGGIKARSQRGGFARTWWGKRWLEALEDYNSPSRMARGRTYARQGQVVSLEVSRGLAVARVQGSRQRPYRVEMRLRMATDGDKEVVLAAAAERPLIAAKLLAGEIPPELEDAFGAAGIPLFPVDDRDMQTRCTCPDWANPCKHIAAVYYLLAEALDDHPAMLLRLRGFDVREFIGALGGHDGPQAADASKDAVGLQRAGGSRGGGGPQGGGAPAARGGRSPGRSDGEAAEERVRRDAEGFEADGLAWDGDPAAFWGNPGDGGRGAGLPLPSPGSTGSPPGAALMVKGRLRAFPLWQGDVPLEEALEAFYVHAADTGTRLLAGEGPAHAPVPDWGPHRFAGAGAPADRPATRRRRTAQRSKKGDDMSSSGSARPRSRPLRRPSLRTVLLDNLGDLAVIVADWGLVLSEADERLVERTPRMVLETVYNRLRDPQAVAGAARQLSPLARDLLFFIVKRGGAVTAEDALETWAAGNRERLAWAVRDAASMHLLFLQAEGRVHGHRHRPQLVDGPDTMLFIPVPFARHLR